MISEDEHHLFMESLRQTLPRKTSPDSRKTLQDNPFCEDADMYNLFEQMFEELSEYDFGGDGSIASEDDA